MQNSSTVKSIQRLLQRLVRLSRFKRDSRRDARPSAIDRSVDCGGYNELYIVSQWAGYSTRH